MATTVALRFPLGRYHANPWGRSVNEGETEWPPSPWRLLRALVATWYTRWADLPAPVLDSLLDSLGEPPSYRTPPTSPAHSRHFLPDLDHRKGGTGNTDLTLDPFLWIPRDAELLVQWPADLNGEQRSVLAKLLELLPYLGRAESVCEGRLLDTDPVADETWWRPGGDGEQEVLLLAPTRPVSRPVLETTTAEVRKARHTMPPGTIRVPYVRPADSSASPSAEPARANGGPVHAVRLAVTGRAPLKSTHGVLLADEAHRLAGRRLTDGGIADGRRRAILGTGRAITAHRHAHWIPIAQGPHSGATVHSLVIWVPQGLRPEEVAALITMRRLSGRRGGNADGDGYEMRGFPPVELLLQAAGPITQVAPELCGPARCWRSLTPYLPVRHRKRETLTEYLTTDIRTELSYRNRDVQPVRVTPLDPEAGSSDRWARAFRRYRMNERLSESRPGLGLRLEFTDDTSGPLLLGKLSHFGYGIFIPETV